MVVEEDEEEEEADEEEEVVGHEAAVEDILHAVDVEAVVEEDRKVNFKNALQRLYLHSGASPILDHLHHGEVQGKSQLHHLPFPPRHLTPPCLRRSDKSCRLRLHSK